MPAGHPEGYIEGFANLYRDAAALIEARRAGRPADPAALAAVPTVVDGAKGMRFIEAAVASSRANGAWTPHDRQATVAGWSVTQTEQGGCHEDRQTSNAGVRVEHSGRGRGGLGQGRR